MGGEEHLFVQFIAQFFFNAVLYGLFKRIGRPDSALDPALLFIDEFTIHVFDEGKICHSVVFEKHGKQSGKW